MIDYLADLESDFSRFHRVDDIYAMDGPRFMRLAWRISAYGGVMAMRLEVQQQDRAQPAVRESHQPAGDDNVVSLAAFMAKHPGMVDHTRGG